MDGHRLKGGTRCELSWYNMGFCTWRTVQRSERLLGGDLDISAFLGAMALVVADFVHFGSHFIGIFKTRF